jgi:hypothetical protein
VGDIALGRKVKDAITGFAGTTTGRATYLSGCTQVLVAPTVGPDGATRESAWFDEQRLAYTDSEKAIVLDNSATPGPDRPAPRH